MSILSTEKLEGAALLGSYSPREIAEAALRAETLFQLRKSQAGKKTESINPRAILNSAEAAAKKIQQEF